MRFLFSLAFVIAMSGHVSAGTLHGRYNQHRLTAHHGQAVPSGAFTRGQPRIAVPGWTDEDTERWLDNASSSWSQA
ncbi:MULTISPECIES: hypothetical protein [unclassified Bradyrhizobium]|uniref:hypothetical protein n=1 Tax=unclassified Bradyrhizobium TaxID=2631580 RepID=UPI000423B48A|nr:MULTISPECIES: hypothetical protein [unclassified Bradyrhizobium]QIG98248.1 hypothetical protein G6P99_42730 [Bradyrhizobium sp. 6(2017)]